MDMTELETKKKEELVEIAKEMGVADAGDLKKQEIIIRLLQTNTEKEGFIFCSGILEIMQDGYGFLRQETLLPSQTDVYISPSQIRRFGLRNGDLVAGQGRPPKNNEKYFSLLQVIAINDLAFHARIGADGTRGFRPASNRPNVRSPAGGAPGAKGTGEGASFTRRLQFYPMGPCPATI